MSTPTILGRLAVAFPRAANWAAKTEAAKVPLPELRQQIRSARAEYWWRTVTEYPGVVKAAEGEAKTFMNKITKPADLTIAEVFTGVVCGVQVFGCFCVGEVLGRGNVAGYSVGKDHFHMVEHHGVM